MARSVRTSKLESRSSRLRLAPSKKAIFGRIAKGLWIGYRRNLLAGTWVMKAGNGAGGHWTKAIGVADDFEEANDSTILDFFQAQTRARAMAVAGKDGDGKDA